jgi:glycine hydroxymethyltransferase
MVDMVHFAGLVAAGLHPDPVPISDIVTTTLHKTLNGPRSGIRDLLPRPHAPRVNTAVYPGQQGGPLGRVIAAKAVALKLAAEPEFRECQRASVEGAATLASALADGGVPLLTGGTDVHFVVVDLRGWRLNGKAAEERLREIGITVNRCVVPFDHRSPGSTTAAAERKAQ